MSQENQPSVAAPDMFVSEVFLTKEEANHAFLAIRTYRRVIEKMVGANRNHVLAVCDRIMAELKDAVDDILTQESKSKNPNNEESQEN